MVALSPNPKGTGCQHQPVLWEAGGNILDNGIKSYVKLRGYMGIWIQLSLFPVQHANNYISLAQATLAYKTLILPIKQSFLRKKQESAMLYKEDIVVDILIFSQQIMGVQTAL